MTRVLGNGPKRKYNSVDTTDKYMMYTHSILKIMLYLMFQLCYDYYLLCTNVLLYMALPPVYSNGQSPGKSTQEKV